MNAILPTLRIACRPGKTGNLLVFPYTIQNLGTVDVYVMDAALNVGPDKRKDKANAQAAVVALNDENYAVIGKIIAPLPTDRTVAVPVVPLARRLPAGGSLTQQLEICTPLAETSPYFPDLPLRHYEIVDIKGVVFAIGYWAANRDNLVACPVECDPDLFQVVTRNTVASAAYVSQRFPATGLQLFKRTDQFPRSLAIGAA